MLICYVMLICDTCYHAMLGMLVCHAMCANMLCHALSSILSWTFFFLLLVLPRFALGCSLLLVWLASVVALGFIGLASGLTFGGLGSALGLLLVLRLVLLWVSALAWFLHPLLV